MLSLAHGWRSGSWTFREVSKDEAWVYDGPWAKPRSQALRVVVTDNPASVEIKPLAPRYAGALPLAVWERISAFVRERNRSLQEQRLAAGPAIDWSRFELGPEGDVAAGDAGRGGHHR